MSRARLGLALATTIAATSCSSSSDPSTGSPQSSTQPLLVRAVDWQSTTDSVGTVQAIVEFDAGVAVFSDLGALVLQGGAVSSTDASVKTWKSSATTIPAADGTGTWVVAIDAAGHVDRLRGGTTLEDITDRYGIADQSVVSVAALGATSVAFGYSGGFAVADGTNVTRWSSGDFGQLVGGGRRVAAITASGISVFDTSTSTFSAYALPSVVAVAIDGNGVLVAATARTLYAEASAGDLRAIYSSPDYDLRAIVAAGPQIWAALGPELLTTSSATQWSIARTTGAQLKSATSLVAGLNQSVWTLDAGLVHKFVIDSGSPSDQQDWETKIQPIFGRVCSACHLPGGSSGFDLSTYPAWLAQRAEIELYVVTNKSMPPQGTTLADADRQTIAAWVAAHAN
ncbi:MAG: c-type cytochrome [Polyangiales bacterium]